MKNGTLRFVLFFNYRNVKIDSRLVGSSKEHIFQKMVWIVYVSANFLIQLDRVFGGGNGLNTGQIYVPYLECVGNALLLHRSKSWVESPQPP